MPEHYVIGLLECGAPRGLQTGRFQHRVDGIAYGMVRLYIGQSTPIFPLTDQTPTHEPRNEEIRARYSQGQSVGYLAQLFGLSEQRVSQIIHYRRK